MITQVQLDRAINVLVPGVYKPVGSPTNKDKGPVLAYVLSPQKTIRGMYPKDPLNKRLLLGLTVSWQDYWRALGMKDDDRWENTFNILLWEEMTFDQLQFVLLHEVGHVDFRMGLHNIDEWGSEIRETFEDEEAYANCFALDHLWRFYGHDEAFRLHSSTIRSRDGQ
jgi:hypothetical protein